MNSAISIIRKATLGICIISAFGFIFNSIVYIMMHLRISENIDLSSLIDRVSIYIGIGLIMLFIFHLIALATIIIQLKTTRKYSVLLSFIFFLSIVSLIMIFGDFALCSDIIKEYSAGLITGIFSEFLVLYFSQLLHLVFFIFVIILVLISWKKPAQGKRLEQVLKDEAIFIDVQYIGIFTSIFGLAILIALSLFTPLWAIKKGIIFLCIILVLPYAMIVIYWLVLKMRERITEWYDEKQFQDVTRASFISFLFSIVILAAFFLIQNLYNKFALMNVIWFPLYFFTALLIFSGTILYLNKKAAE